MVWWAAAVCAFFIKGLCGFANTLVFTTILSFAADNVSISPIELLLGYPSNLILAWKERSFIRWRLCLPLAALVSASSVPGILFLKNADAATVKIIFGAVIILIGLEMLLRELRQKKVRLSRAILVLIGVLSGLLCGLYGVGALLGAYMSQVTEDSRAFKANICVVFFMENTLRIFLYSLWGILTPDILKRAAVLIPFMLAGLALGMASSRALDEKLVKKCVIILLILSGAALIFNSL
ncbi:sulfite exporter TauE/SafE family protein [uncultured Oscillibacter sp.]|uniref:sulfite exporter TauE/SafE family protein n=1 Tax=uncultured Oscillibacter sp. TaxID=876091 RepID=UPI0026169E41|nr:sulfite exporter TauE/SafE family protein [uncultured Oscillibacter sp.]